MHGVTTKIKSNENKIIIIIIVVVVVVDSSREQNSEKTVSNSFGCDCRR